MLNKANIVLGLLWACDNILRILSWAYMWERAPLIAVYLGDHNVAEIAMREGILVGDQNLGLKRLDHARTTTWRRQRSTASRYRRRQRRCQQQQRGCDASTRKWFTTVTFQWNSAWISSNAGRRAHRPLCLSLPTRTRPRGRSSLATPTPPKTTACPTVTGPQPTWRRATTRTPTFLVQISKEGILIFPLYLEIDLHISINDPWRLVQARLKYHF